MAGIFGVYDPALNSEQLSALADRMRLALMHEPWYRPSVTTTPPLAAGRVSLGVFNHEAQPGANEDGSVQVWFDGEITAFQRRAWLDRLRQSGHQLRAESDADLLAHLYEELGDDCVTDLDATFAVALWDRRHAKVLLAVDRDAGRPLYFSVRDQTLWFASEVKALLQDRRVPRAVDAQGVIEFFTYRHVLADRTLFKAIRFLPAGHRAVFHAGQVEVRPYWTPAVFEDRPARRADEYLAEIDAALRQATERHTHGAEPLGEFLSGGLDSRLLAAALPTAQLNGRFHTFSRGPLECWDVKYGTQVGQRLGGQHHVLELKPDFLPAMARQGVWLTDGLMTVVDIYVLSTIKQLKPLIDIVFFGFGRTDGLLGGIEIDQRLLQARSLAEAARLFYGRQGIYITDALQDQLLTPELRGPWRGAAFETLVQMLGTFQANSYAGLIEAFCLQCRWPRSSSYGPVLARTQVETRFPFSDNELTDLVMRVPARLRLDRQFQLALIKRLRPDLARVPWEYSGLPADISSPTLVFLQRALYYAQRQASKWTSGLIPPGTERERANYPVWFRTVLRPWLEDVLLDRRTLERGYYQPVFLRQMLADHLAGRQNYATEFGLLLTFELWNRLFVDDEPVGA